MTRRRRERERQEGAREAVEVREGVEVITAPGRIIKKMGRARIREWVGRGRGRDKMERIWHYRRLNSSDAFTACRKPRILSKASLVMTLEGSGTWLKSCLVRLTEKDQVCKSSNGDMIQ